MSDDRPGEVEEALLWFYRHKGDGWHYNEKGLILARALRSAQAELAAVSLDHNYGQCAFRERAEKVEAELKEAKRIASWSTLDEGGWKGEAIRQQHRAEAAEQALAAALAKAGQISLSDDELAAAMSESGWILNGKGAVKEFAALARAVERRVVAKIKNA